MTERWLIVGLGNPGKKYAPTRHNIGYLVLDELAARTESALTKDKRAGATSAEARLGGIPGHRVVLARSNDYMNLAGQAVGQLAAYHGVDPAHVVAIHDDVDLDFEAIKLKIGGSEGGHNGLRSLTKHLGTRDYLRVRAGVGRPPGRMDTADYVLKPFASNERTTLPIFVSELADAVESLLDEGLEATQQKFHSR